MNLPIVIIGNGIAANTAASVIKRFNSQAQITIVSEETFPEYSACVLPNYLCQEINREKVFLKKMADYDADNIKVILGQKALGIDTDNNEVCLESARIAYSELIIATGSKPVVPPIAGISKEGIFTFKSLADADKIKAHTGNKVVIIGSGPIGIEAAIALRKRGYQVSLAELLDWILPRVFDKHPALIIRNILEENGIEVLTGEKIIRILGNNSVEGVVTEKRELKCDLVILVTGMKPEVSLAHQSRIDIGELGGIKTDEHMLTSIRDVYACGDCVQARDTITGENSLSLLWHNAKAQGEIAGYNCVGLPKTYPGSYNITTVNVFGTHAVSIGKTSADLDQNRVKVIEGKQGKGCYRLITSDGKLVGIQSIAKTRDMGVLMNLIRRRDELKELNKMPWSKASLNINSWRCKIRPYCGHPDKSSSTKP